MTERIFAADLFDLTAGDTHITYSTSSIAGTPRLTYQDGSESRGFSGEEIRHVDTEIGAQVSVTLSQVPDRDTLTLTLILPQVNLPYGSEAQIDAVAILTTAKTTIGGPGLVEGAVQSYRVMVLSGTARTVEF
ncbi:MAG: hypothetical protein RMK29_21740 [Myxococcales bacterium]|nr:hypothetical protein [Myxococcota bacterium]MDW8284336.1 hypothetical protein [Myxococcales bacterium]